MYYLEIEAKLKKASVKNLKKVCDLMELEKGKKAQMFSNIREALCETYEEADRTNNFKIVEELHNRLNDML